MNRHGHACATNTQQTGWSSSGITTTTMNASKTTPQGAPAQNPFAAYNRGKADREAGRLDACPFIGKAQRDEYAKGYRDGAAPAQLPNTLPELAAHANTLLEMAKRSDGSEFTR